MDYSSFMLTTREDELKNHILNELNITLDMRYNIDCYTPNVLFEFKYEKDVKKPDVLAQALYYLNSLYENGDKVPLYVCLINKSEVIIFETSNFFDFWCDSSNFLNGHASQPSNNVIDKAKDYTNDIYFYSSLECEDDYIVALNSLKDLLKSKKIIKDKIRVTNVRRAYKGYIRQLGDYILSNSSSKGVFEFRADSIGKATIISMTTLDNYVIDFQFANGAKRFDNIDKTAYDSYWKQWKRIDNEEDAIDVFKSIYDLLGISDRRTKGQFYTPKDVAIEAWNRITNELGQCFYDDGNWRIWDCCAGTGNLEYEVLPQECMQYLYLSTLDIEEVDQLREKFPLARDAFQYNFLNDHNNQLPKKLKEDMENPNIKWLFLINPPYVEAQGVTGNASGTTESNFQTLMKINNLGNAGREMFAQFLYRIENDFKNKYFLGLFSSTKFIVSNKFVNFRKFWQPTFKGGFVLNSAEHFQCKGEWPLIFSLFDRTTPFVINFGNDIWRTNDLTYDIYDKNMNIIGSKKFKIINKENDFRNYFINIVNTSVKKYPLLKSGLNLSTTKQYIPPYGPSNMYGCLVFIGADFQQQNRSYLVSGLANTNHNNIFITDENYLNVLSGFGLYKAPKINWLNNKDRFSIPSRELSDEELYDSILYSLVCDSNQTATYKFKDGSIIMNKLNPLDERLFDFSKCSDIGKIVFNDLKEYLLESVKYDKVSTIFGKGVFIGLLQYKKENNNDTQCYNIKFSDKFNEDIEKLRIKVEEYANELCF